MRRLALCLALTFAMHPAAYGEPASTGGEAAPKAAAKPAPAPKLAPNEIAIYVGDMHCATCAKKIAGKLYRLKGVVRVKTDVKKNLAIVTPQAKKPLDPKAAWAAVQAAGFKPTRLIAPEGTFVADAKSKEPKKLPPEAAPANAG